MNEFLNSIRETTPNLIAEDLCSVQPMDTNIIKNLLTASKTKEDLILEGYKPVSNLGLMWIKED